MDKVVFVSPDTTISIKRTTHAKLLKGKDYPKESHDSVINRLLKHYKKKGN